MYIYIYINIYLYNLYNSKRYLKKPLQPDNEIGSVNIFLQKSCTKYGDKTSPRPS